MQKKDWSMVASPGCEHVSGQQTAGESRQLFSAPSSSWIASIVYLFSLSLFGLDFYPALLIAVAVMVRSYFADRHDFFIQLTLFFGCYALTDPNRAFPVKPSDIALLLSLIAVLVCRFNKTTREIGWGIFCYAIMLFLFALISEESMAVQLLSLRNYLAIAYFFVGFLVFANHPFNIHSLFRSIIVYSTVLCLFYVIDGFILCGWILIPNSATLHEGDVSSFFSPIFSPFSFDFVRKYPPGLYLLSLCVYPSVCIFNLRHFQWILIAAASVACRTMTFIFGLLIGGIAAAGPVRRTLRLAAVAAVAVTLLFFIDDHTGQFLRVASTVRQFTEFSLPEEQFDGEQVEETVGFGSGRAAQVIPKVMHLYERGDLLTGFGFLHPQLTSNPDFIILNPFYPDISVAEEVATGVEVTQFQTLLDIGLIGLILQTGFFIWLYLKVRKMEYGRFLLSVLVVFFFSGFGGFGGWIQPASLYLISISLFAVVKHNRMLCG